MENVSLLNVSKQCLVNNAKFSIVEDISFDIAPREIFGLLGINGAGKTTTIKMLAGLTIPDSGKVRVFGMDPSRAAAQKVIGTILEGNRNLYWQLSALENLVYFGVLKGMSIKNAKRKAMKLMEQFDFLQHSEKRVQNMSRGMQQKLAIKVALMHGPKLLILDEPTLGLDGATRDFFSQFICEVARELDVAVLLTSHDLEFVGRTATSFGILNSGRLVKKGLMTDLDSLVNSSGYRVKLAGEIPRSSHVLINKFGDEVKRSNPTDFVVSKDYLYRFLQMIEPTEILQVKSLANNLEDLVRDARMEA